MSSLYKKEIIAGKEIYTVENHQHALVPWALYRQKLETPPVLLTLDHHTDSHSAFLGYAVKTLNSSSTGNMDCNGEFRNSIIKEVNCLNDDSVITAAKRLKDDEQIDAAIRTKIIKLAYVINYDGYGDQPTSFEMERYYEEQSPLKRMFRTEEPILPKRPFTYPKSPKSIYIVDPGCHSKCLKECHNDDCQQPHYNEAIETVYLMRKFQTIFEMARSTKEFFSFFDLKYILDIDLDYFHTEKSINPDDMCFFYYLIRHAGIICIATEPDYFKAPAYEMDKINSEIVRNKILEHVSKALGV